MPNASRYYCFASLIALSLATAITLQTARAQQPEKREHLSAAQVKELLTGNSLAGNGRVKDPAKPYDWIAHYAQDGKLHFLLKPETFKLFSVGEWWMEDNGETCRKFGKKLGCWHFVREGEYLRFVPSKGVAVEGRAIALPGDALKRYRN